MVLVVMSMDDSNLMLAVLACGRGATYTPVQIQKLLFLAEKQIGDKLGGPFFRFVPYDYGPFDAKIYELLATMAGVGLVEIVHEPGLRWNKYRLTDGGLQQGERMLQEMEQSVATFLRRLNEFVRRLSFAELVGAIYKAYPEMKVNSVFRE